MALQKGAKVMFTDSGGTQEETTILGIPCITLRENTERPVTITEGTNTLVGNVPENIRNAFEDAISTKQIEKKIPKFWDGKTAERIINILIPKFD
jgi:UDP-N-acetylglucosamine 2-epimerase (non-hydrolysing)